MTRYLQDGRGGSSSWNVSRFTVLCMELATGRRRVEDAAPGKLVDMYTGSDRHIHRRIGTGRREEWRMQQGKLKFVDMYSHRQVSRYT